MADPWQILRDGGLPLATPGSGRRPPAPVLAGAIREAIATEPRGRDAEALAAFVFAWSHHWPASFAAELGDAAHDVLAWAAPNAGDDGRYLKLRRIAIENLSAVL